MIDYKKYKVWEKAHAFVLKTYALTANFPKSEMFNLTSQINRATFQYLPTSRKASDIRKTSWKSGKC
ncbi:four helix bundle protein [Flavobacterium sp. HJ-32-4]|uniref:four helix bundle protein n=1 Tax=unclassified Flavobacterium TaxID=196869 RepID=UPI0035304DCB